VTKSFLPRYPTPPLPFSSVFKVVLICLGTLPPIAGCQPTSTKPDEPVANGSVVTPEKPPPTDPAELVAAIEASGGKLKKDAAGWVVEVDYRSTSLTDGDLPELHRLMGLQSLLLAETKITDASIARIAECAKLRSLDLRECAVSNAAMETLSGLKQLQVLKLASKGGGTTVDDAGMSAIGKMTQLRSLALDYLWISEEGLKQLKELKGLQELYLAQTLVGDEALPVIAGFVDLKRLRLARTQVTGEGLAALESLRKIEDIDLSECSQLTDAGMPSLGKLTTLKRLNLWRDQLSDEGVSHLAGLSNMEWLNLDNTQLTSSGAASLSGMKKLVFLHLGSTGLSNSGLSALEGLTALKDLKVTRTAVTEEGVAELQKKLPQTNIQLKYLDTEP
jgi:hypothetical protein